MCRVGLAFFVSIVAVEAFHRVDPKDYPRRPKQLSVKVEVVLIDIDLVEDFTIHWDEDLRLAKYEYALGREMAPFNSSRPMKTIMDFNNGNTPTHLQLYKLDIKKIFLNVFFSILLSDKRCTSPNVFSRSVRPL